MRFIDTNLFIRYFTKDDEKKAQKVLGLFKRLEKEKEIVITSSLVILEIVFTLEKFYQVSKEEIREILSPILYLKGLKLQDKDIYIHALEIYVQKNSSFADAFNTAFAIKNKVKEIYSYDDDFDKIEQLKRIIP